MRTAQTVDVHFKRFAKQPRIHLAKAFALLTGGANQFPEGSTCNPANSSAFRGALLRQQRQSDQNSIL